MKAVFAVLFALLLAFFVLAHLAGMGVCLYNLWSAKSFAKRRGYSEDTKAKYIRMWTLILLGLLLPPVMYAVAHVIQRVLKGR